MAVGVIEDGQTARGRGGYSHHYALQGLDALFNFNISEVACTKRDEALFDLCARAGNSKRSKCGTLLHFFILCLNVSS